MIAVEDTGIGISEANLQKLFEPYEQSEDEDKRKYDGTGLGLAISKGIIELMGGEISVKSKINEGTTFTILIENVRVPPEFTEIADGEEFDPSAIVFEKQKILIADDEREIRNIIKGYLEDTEIEVLEAEDGQKALQILKEHKPDLILMDLVMPGMSGIEVTQKLRKNKKLKDIPILAFTAVKTYQDDVEKYENLFKRYLFKPISKSRLFYELAFFLNIKTLSEKKKSLQMENIGTIVLTPENREMLPEITKQLNEYQALWESACKSNNFNEIKNFGLKIRELGDQYSVDVLSDYGNKIILYVESSKIKKIKSFLHGYPILIDKLKS